MKPMDHFLAGVYNYTWKIHDSTQDDHLTRNRAIRQLLFTQCRVRSIIILHGNYRIAQTNPHLKLVTTFKFKNTTVNHQNDFLVKEKKLSSNKKVSLKETFAKKKPGHTNFLVSKDLRITEQ